MALQEYYNTNDDGAQSLYGSSWKAQTFTTVSAYLIDSVKLKLYKTGSPGTITVSIRATDVNGRPTGSDLDGVTGTIADSELTTDSGGEWETITLSDSIELSDATKYAIVVRATSGNGSNAVYWRSDNSSPTYADGNVCGSATSGGSWYDIAAADAMFECYGTAVSYIDFSGTGGGTGAGSALLTKSTYIEFAGTNGGTGGGSAAMIVSGFPHDEGNITIKRLVAAANNEIWYEDI